MAVAAPLRFLEGLHRCRCSAVIPLLIGILFPSVSSTGTLSLLQWNPHWQCFVWNQDDCANRVVALANEYLEKYDVDFANFIELESKDWRPREGWMSVESTRDCSNDITEIVYNTARWTVSTDPAHKATGCLEGNDRPFVLQVFYPRKGSWVDVGINGVIVVGAHFPHPGRRDKRHPFSFTKHISDVLEVLTASTGIQQVVLIADTNCDNKRMNTLIAEELKFPGQKVIGTSLQHTCCADSKYASRMTFDRIIANFGAAESGDMETQLPMEDPPAWTRQVHGGRVGAFHKPILALLPFDHTAGVGSPVPTPLSPATPAPMPPPVTPVPTPLPSPHSPAPAQPTKFPSPAPSPSPMPPLEPGTSEPTPFLVSSSWSTVVVIGSCIVGVVLVCAIGVHRICQDDVRSYRGAAGLPGPSGPVAEIVLGREGPRSPPQPAE
eukprot:CAMPEP_0206437444 /NCGR_PEP_ID=MMETSP0324_2-20121206/11045_1 /ASSEMBLY_ACC=CAM_ASM_000836 /TAXON_ID=2866 /ORGANISM="Crypthecodinium cohnii, Strain Seligo" /LENGTH=436 /DNA_ID=CAMNT_0053904727 /DNA_START=22 /DNA_END=1332 /DNA_ORIENTATION=-